MKSSHIVLTILAVLCLVAISLGGCSDNATGSNERPMSLSSSRLEFTGWAGRNPDPAQQKVVVMIEGQGTIDWTASATADWLRLGPGGSDTIFVTVISDTLLAGDYTDTITVASPSATNSPLTISVFLTVRNRITVAPDSLAFVSLAGDNAPAPDTIVISDFEAQGVSYELSTTAAWLDPDITNGIVPGTVAVAVDISGMTGGQYTGSIVVTSADLPGSVATVECQLHLSSWAGLDLGFGSAGINFEGVQFSDALTGWTSGWSPWNVTQHRGYVYRTEDGGDNWTNVLDRTGVKLGGLAVLDESRCWVVGDSAWVEFSSNGGGDWNKSDNLPLDTAVDLARVFFVGYHHGWVIGDLGTILHTENAGLDWTLQTTPTQHNLSGLHFLDSQIGWVVGNHGTILHTGDGGTTWAAQSAPQITDLRAVWMVNSTAGWVVGSQGAVYKTDNGGATWAEESIGTNRYLTDVMFISPTRGWVIGLDGTIVHTNDGGLTWLLQPTGLNEGLFDVFFLDDNLGWVAGDGGTVLKTASGGF